MHYLTVFSVLLLPPVWASPYTHHRRDATNAMTTSDSMVGSVINTTSGPVTRHSAANYSEVSEYLGIPFGQAPIGDLRFAPPVAFNGTAPLNGSSYGFSCPNLPTTSSSTPTAEQIAFSNITTIGLGLAAAIADPAGVLYDEDCLFLNVWVKPGCDETPKPVMIWIHGGAFSAGTGSNWMSSGAALANNEDVIVVSINYRLSIFGWPGSPGLQNNIAFLDQRLAIEWVHNNIASFGGDPNLITLVGQSAGAASIDYYSYAFASDPLVAGLIEQSGNVFAFDLPYSATTSATAWYTVTTAVGCGNSTTASSTDILSCMRSTPIDSIWAAVPVTGLSSLLSAFGPTIDDHLVFSNYSSLPAPDIPLLIGSNDYEVGQFRTQLGLSYITFPDSDWDALMLADYTCPASSRANASVAVGAPVWRYRFFAVFPNTNISYEGGAYHGAEIQLVFGTTFQDPADTPQEATFVIYIQGAWAAFARDPVGGLVGHEDGWPVYDPQGETLIRLGFENGVGANVAFPGEYDAGCWGETLEELVCRLLGYC